MNLFMHSVVDRHLGVFNFETGKNKTMLMFEMPCCTHECLSGDKITGS